MQLDHISLLQCPYCHTALKVDFLLPDRPGYATVHCDCDTYPVIEGIVYLRKNAPQLGQKAVELLRAGKSNEALRILFSEERKLTRFLYTVLLGFPLSLRGFIRSWKLVVPGSKAWQNYLLHREKRVSFILSAATLSFIQDSGVVTDIGCGTGHFLNKAAQIHPSSQLIGIDGSFPLLYLAKRFFLKKNLDRCLLVCADIDSGIPLKDETSTSVFCNDAFMYFHRKKHVAQEMLRVMCTKGRLFITHLHHRQAQNLGQGYGMSVQDVRALLPELCGYIASDRSLFHTLLDKHALTYIPLSAELKEEDFYNSFSVIWMKEKKTTVKTQLPDEEYSLIMPQQVDYTEDEYIQHGLSTQ